MKYSIYIIISGLIFCTAELAFAEKKPDTVETALEKNQDKPINIKSESLTLNNPQNLAIFTKDVVVTQGTMIIKADEMKVFSDLDTKTKKNKFKRIEAYGNVYLNSESREAKAKTAIYDVVNQKIEMYDNVYLNENGNTLQGSKFIYDLGTGKTAISNSKDYTNNKIEEPVDIENPKNKDGFLDKAFEGVSVPQSTSNGRVKVEFTPGEGMKNFDVPKPPIKIKSSTEQKQRMN